MVGLALADLVTCDEAYWWNPAGPSDSVHPRDDGKPLVVVYDFGVKWNILRRLRAEGFRVRVVPARTRPEDVLALAPDGVVLSNGPGDPEASPGPHDSRPWFRAVSEEIGGTGGRTGRPPAEPEPLETPAGFSPEAPAELPAKASAGSPAKTPAGSPAKSP